MNNRFDAEASQWDAKPHRMEMAEKFANEIKQVTDKNKTAFEYGCGTANVSFALKDSFRSITLADSSQGMIDEVNKKIKEHSVTHFKTMILDLEKDNFDNKFDVIYTLMTLHHVKDVEYVIRQFSNMLNAGGMLIIGDLVEEDGNFHTEDNKHDVHFGFKKEYLTDILSSNNLIVEDYKVFHEIERTHTGVAKMYPLFLISAEKQ